MPAQKKPPVPVSTPTDSPSLPSSSSRARCHPLGERRVDGVSHLGSVERDQQHVASLGQNGLRGGGLIEGGRIGGHCAAPCSDGRLAREHSSPTRADREGARRTAQAANRRSSGWRSPRSTWTTFTQSIPRALASTRACGLIVWAASTPRQEPSAGSRRLCGYRGVAQVPLSDPVVDELLAANPRYVKDLKRYRHSVFHYQPTHVDITRDRCSHPRRGPSCG